MDSKLLLTGSDKVKILKINVDMYSRVTIGQNLFVYEILDGHEIKDDIIYKKFKCHSVGVLKKILIKEGDVVSPGDPVFIIQSCNHPTVMKEMCAECGADLKEDSSTGKKDFSACIPMIHSIPELIVSSEQAQVLGKADEERLLKFKKLVLLVDLDQTLIHTTNDNIPNNMKDVFHFQLYGSHSVWYHTKLRPWTYHFLEEISKFYELHICTFGARMYAHKIASILDPDGKFFSHRILSRDECFHSNSKTANLKALFPCGENLVCIIDDREDVWNYASNLVHVKPYHFFQHTGDIHAPTGLSKWEDNEMGGCYNQSVDDSIKKSTNLIDKNLEHSEDSQYKKDEKINPDSNKDQKDLENDDYLLHLEDILKTIHKAFYDLYDQLQLQNKNEIPDLKNVIPYVRRKVLQSVTIVFSGLIPTNMALEQSRAYGIARSLGANVSDRIIFKKTNDELSTTHVVAAKLGTAKVNEVYKHKDIQLVAPDWLWACAERWEHVDERLYPLSREGSIMRMPPSHCLSPDKSGNRKTYIKDSKVEVEVNDTFPKYNPYTGKRIRLPSEKLLKIVKPCSEPPIVVESEDSLPTDEKRIRMQSDNFIDSYNPLLAFSSDEIASMDQEVENIFQESDSEESSEENSSQNNETETHKHNNQNWEENSSSNSENNYFEDKAHTGELEDTDWNNMGAALEREFLKN